MEDIERCTLVKPEVFVYKIPPRTSARGYRAADWHLASPDWTGRLRFIVKGTKCELRLEDKNTGELFAVCPVEKHPGTSIEPVTDSSRYFVLCIQDSGRKAFIGLGFADRSDSFDLNVALQDHFKWVKKEDNFAKEEPPPNLDLAFKEGQTIRVNINIPIASKKSTTTTSSTQRPKGTGILPPPPSSNNIRIAPPPGSTPVQSPTEEPIKSSVIKSGVDLLSGLDAPPPPPARPAPAAAATNTAAATAAAAASNDDPWGDFTSSQMTTTTKKSGNWEKF